MFRGTSHFCLTLLVALLLFHVPAAAVPSDDEGVASRSVDAAAGRCSDRKVAFPAPPANRPLSGRTVVVDAGHGGRDGGAVRAGVKEKDLSLAIALELKSALENEGATVVMTREDDRTLTKEERVDKANEVCPDVFVSVHANAMPQRASAMQGVETYYYKADSKELASVVHDSLVSALSAADRGVRRDELYVINHTVAPAVLVESGYLSNGSERAKLTDPAYQRQVASAICRGLVKFFAAPVQPDGSSGKQSGDQPPLP